MCTLKPALHSTCAEQVATLLRGALCEPGYASVAAPSASEPVSTCTADQAWFAAQAPSTASMMRAAMLQLLRSSCRQPLHSCAAQEPASRAALEGLAVAERSGWGAQTSCARQLWNQAPKACCTARCALCCSVSWRSSPSLTHDSCCRPGLSLADSTRSPQCRQYSTAECAWAVSASAASWPSNAHQPPGCRQQKTMAAAFTCGVCGECAAAPRQQACSFQPSQSERNTGTHAQAPCRHQDSEALQPAVL